MMLLVTVCCCCRLSCVSCLQVQPSSLFVCQCAYSQICPDQHAMLLLLLQVELCEPPAGAAIGERVTVEGYSGQPDEQLNPKKKIFEQIQPDLMTNDGLVACYKGVPLMTSAGPVKVASVAGASIK